MEISTAYDHTVDHIPQARKIMGKVKIMIRRTGRDTRFLRENSNREKSREGGEKIHYNLWCTRIIGILYARLSARLLGFEKKKIPLAGRERLYMLHPPYVHEGGWYERDPYTCWFVVTVVMIGAWSLGFHAEKFALVYNCPTWRALTRYAHRGGLSYITVGVDLEWSVAITVDEGVN